MTSNNITCGNSNGKFLLDPLIDPLIFMLFPRIDIAMMSERKRGQERGLRFALQTKNVIQFISNVVRISVSNMQSTVHAEYAMRSPTYIFCGRNFIGWRLPDASRNKNAQS